MITYDYRELLDLHPSDSEVIIEVPNEEPPYIVVESTFYTSNCKGCIGITKTGDDVRHTIYANGLRVIAVDPSVIPLRSTVLVELENGVTFTAIASDIGGDIKGNRIDVLVATDKEAYDLGRKFAKVTILD